MDSQFAVIQLNLQCTLLVIASKTEYAMLCFCHSDCPIVGFTLLISNLNFDLFSSGSIMFNSDYFTQLA